MASGAWHTVRGAWCVVRGAWCLRPCAECQLVVRRAVGDQLPGLAADALCLRSCSSATCSRSTSSSCGWTPTLSSANWTTGWNASAGRHFLPLITFHPPSLQACLAACVAACQPGGLSGFLLVCRSLSYFLSFPLSLSLCLSASLPPSLPPSLFLARSLFLSLLPAHCVATGPCARPLRFTSPPVTSVHDYTDHDYTQASSMSA